MNELEPRKVVGAGLMAAGFSLIIFAIFAAVPAASWAQDGAPRFGCAPAGVPYEQSRQRMASAAQHYIANKCDPGYGITMLLPKTAEEGGVTVCCVQK